MSFVRIRVILTALGSVAAISACGTARARAQQVTVALTPRAPAAMLAAANAASTPGSPGFRHYLSVAQFARRFGARSSAVAAVTRTLRAHGLHVEPVSRDHLMVSVDGSLPRLAAAFGARVKQVRRAHGDRALELSGPPRLNRRLKPYVQAVLGLGAPVRMPSEAPGETSWRHRHSGSLPPAAGWARTQRAHAITGSPLLTGGPQPCSAASRAVRPQQFGPGWTANQVAYAYDFGPLYRSGDKGQGVTIALYEQEPDLPSDIAAFQRCYGTHVQVSYVRVGRGAGSGAGSGEATGDIDQLISFVPRARIIVYDGPANSPGAADPVLSAIVNQDRANVVSSSWGDCEPEEGRAAAIVDNNLLEEAAIQGQTFVTASGDDGAEDCYVAGSDHNRAVTVDSPGSSPWATVVGGTLLSGLAPLSETVWNNVLSGNLAGSGISAGSGGGGVSSFWPMPAYQTQAPSGLGVIGPLSTGSPCGAPAGGHCREVPDVSASADPMEGYATYLDGEWQTWGGTSAGTPVWAAVFALADATPGCVRHRVGFVNPALYALADRAFVNGSYDAYFNDVTSGNNDILRVNNGAFAAGPGYDMASGLGSPRAAQIVAALCGDTLRVRAIAAQRVMRVGHAQSVQLRIGLLPAGVTGVGFHASGLPRGLVLNPSTGLVSGTPRQPGTYAVSFWATGSLQSVAPALHATWVVRH